MDGDHHERTKRHSLDDESDGGMTLTERSIPVPGPGQVLLRINAATLNYRDLAILQGTYKLDFGPFIPVSDGAGTIVGLGEGVARFKVGDRAIPVYTQGWIGGRPTSDVRANRTLGVPINGVLCEYIAISADDAVATPAHLLDIEGATLPIAALTAWTTLREGAVKPGDWVLTMGTGGVAIFALQFAKLAGAQVIALSSSEEKLAKVRALGADTTINYRMNPNWAQAVKAASGGRGADIIVETAGTLSQSLGAAAFGGFVGVIGFTGGYRAELDIRQVIGPMLRIHGIAVGSRSSFEAMNRAIAQHALKPVVERVFALEETRQAFELMQGGGHFGKIAIAL
jgi:NADPH:quinone reductase-like Zn-dependent oxidoreductase